MSTNLEREQKPASRVATDPHETAPVASEDGGSRTLRVHLADAPRDVLVWLADQPVDNWWTPHFIAESAAPSDADDAVRSASGAISTLHGCGLVEGCRVEGIPMFRATDEGRRLVEEARRG